jgi:hypothetical protein
LTSRSTTGKSTTQRRAIAAFSRTDPIVKESSKASMYRLRGLRTLREASESASAYPPRSTATPTRGMSVMIMRTLVFWATTAGDVGNGNPVSKVEQSSYRDKDQ